MGQLGATADRGDHLIVRTKKGGTYVTEDLGKTVEAKASMLGTAKSVVGTVAKKAKEMGGKDEET